MTEAVTFAANFRLYKVEPHNMPVMELLQNGDEHTFEQVFKTHYKNLHAYAFTIIKNHTTAEEVVQNVFFKLWERKAQLAADTQLKAYLYRAVHNESLNHIKHEKVKNQYKMHAISKQEEYAQPASKKITLTELEEHVREALNELPEQCRTIFQMSRFQELKYREIADELGLAVKTVENQMGKALKILRSRLAEFLPLLILINIIL